MIIDGKSISKEIIEEVKKGILEAGTFNMTAVAYEEDVESLVYFNSIKKNAEKIGINFNLLVIKGEQLIERIDELNRDKSVDAIIVGRPFPKGITNDMVALSLDPDKDADCVTPQNMGQLYLGIENVAPATARAAIDILERNNIELRGKSAVIINRSVTVGRPLSQMLLNRDVTVTVAHSKTKDIEGIIERSDIVFLAVGKAGYLKASTLKSKKIIVDIGINVVDGKVKGDFDPDQEREGIDYTPVPGGVGSVTSAEILRNGLILAKSRRGEKD
jgi:methylenetetrahydrofolate dehydrogenase (NADP+)/methenyltetrahydrofolate cyclohydrolase